MEVIELNTISDGANHLETFYNGSWRYSRKLGISNRTIR